MVGDMAKFAAASESEERELTGELTVAIGDIKVTPVAVPNCGELVTVLTCALDGEESVKLLDTLNERELCKKSENISLVMYLFAFEATLFL